MQIQEAQKKLCALEDELHKGIVEYDDIVTMVVLALISDFHVLLKAMPGLGKTYLLGVLQRCVAGMRAQRIQGSPDLTPASFIGTMVFDPKSGDFKTRKGEIFTDFLLADELNRMTPKAQAGFLQAMQEREVTIGAETFKLSDLFFVMATINPAELGGEGTFPLTEAALDRIHLSLKMDYISRQGEIDLAMRDSVHGRDPFANINPVVNREDVLEVRRLLLELTEKMPLPVVEYIVDLVESTRPGQAGFNLLKQRTGLPLDKVVKFGLSPRAIITTKRIATALALRDGRPSASYEDVKAVFPAVAAHRIALTDTAPLSGWTPERVVQTVLDAANGVALVTAGAGAAQPKADVTSRKRWWWFN